MSDHWLYFPCRVGDDLAFIFYDHGVREAIDGWEAANLLRVRIGLRAPHENGLPAKGEFEALTALEDALQAALVENGGAYVGRITSAGEREFLAYVEEGEAAWAERLVDVIAEHGYAPTLSVEPDPARCGYWDELFPSDHDWQVIQDLQVIDQLLESGDDPSLARRIDHWATFPRREEAASFRAWAEGEGYHVEGILDPDETDACYAVRLYHVGAPRIEDVSQVTIRLSDAARERGGEYDGWETTVEAEPRPGPGR